ncbi:hypothetical protein N7495_008582 [Penicillium taxi]|uniref:uncharacterized protein n=1 Tax=Penicillium taxi TaxID=168475 RepID=UPI00254559C8|nr:uncharacterized protein N7495_008582 [Penicillium taxi]KAJ5888541.1 hypothetical protein N7495_008582 [Penicillium taxi]
MPLTLHHLGLSQSERIIWLAEELGLDYNFVHHKRDPIFAPKSLKDLHPAGTAPVIEDDPSPVTNSRVVLTESGAIIDYLIAVHGNGRLALTPKDADYPHFIEWYHFANGSFQPLWISIMMTRASKCDPDSPILKYLEQRAHSIYAMIDARLAETGAFIAGKELTAADIMIFSLFNHHPRLHCYS